MAEIAVEDDGPGFQREVMGQVFDPYVTTKAKGTGLGLAIVRKIVEEHGGHIEADNSTGGGARVRVDLPLHDAGTDSHARGRGSYEPRRERA
jgi:nitrogen fixation/metabolism regulation signal transduction histidine kinase